MKGEIGMGEKTVKEIMEAETVFVENGIEYYEVDGLSKTDFWG